VDALTMSATVTIALNSGAVGLVITGIILLLRGDLMPRPFVKMLLDSRDQLLTASQEREKQWRDAYYEQKRVSDTFEAQQRQSRDIGATTQHVLAALPAPTAPTIVSSGTGGGTSEHDPVA
jgi:hypothetical protein